jgi:hydroxyacylglutathione hydrolase
MAAIPLEDNFEDILAKAQRGLRIPDSTLAQRAGITAAQLAEAKSKKSDDNVIRKIAGVLNLGPDTLLASAKQTWRPRDPGPVDGFASFNTPFSDMTVNSYLVFDPQTRQAAAFDTGADADSMLQFIHDKQLHLGLILLTHTHTDHVFDLDRLHEATSAPAFVSERELLPNAEPFADDRTFSVGGLKIGTLRTSGHARGGTTFVVTGLSHRLAIVGDALFAGSMGGGMVDYDEALRTNRASIFTLPDDTIICPGHGPLTTVGEEKLHNPFYPEFQQQQASQQQ